MMLLIAYLRYRLMKLLGLEKGNGWTITEIHVDHTGYTEEEVDEQIEELKKQGYKEL